MRHLPKWAAGVATGNGIQLAVNPHTAHNPVGWVLIVFGVMMFAILAVTQP